LTQGPLEKATFSGGPYLLMQCFQGRTQGGDWG